jgi:hypothetical protein
MQQTIRLYEYDNNLIEKIDRNADTILVECFADNAFSVTLPDLVSSHDQQFNFKNYGASFLTVVTSNYQIIDFAEVYSHVIDGYGFLNIFSDGIDRWVKGNGDDTVWDDMRVVPGSFDRPGVADPDIVAYAPAGGAISTYLWEFSKNDIASFTIQLPHAYKVGTDIYCHIHWTPGARGNEESGNLVGWKVDYTWASIDSAFGAMATLDLSDACNGVDHEHDMTPNVVISGSGKGISSMLICNIKRTDTGTDDTWVSTTSGRLPMLLEIDFHYQIDALGSKLISTK